MKCLQTYYTEIKWHAIDFSFFCFYSPPIHIDIILLGEWSCMSLRLIPLGCGAFWACWVFYCLLHSFFWQFISICQIYCLHWLLSLRFLIEKLTLHVRYLVFCYAWCLTAKHPSISSLVLVWVLICNLKNKYSEMYLFSLWLFISTLCKHFLLVYCSIYVWKMVFWFVSLFAFVINRKKTQLSDITG